MLLICNDFEKSVQCQYRSFISSVLLVGQLVVFLSVFVDSFLSVKVLPLSMSVW